MKQVLVIGLGISGCAAAAFLLRQGYRVCGIDREHAIANSSPQLDRLKSLGLETQSEALLKDPGGFQLVVVSPGIAPGHPVYQAALNLNIEVIGEAELAFRYLRQPCLGITGTNGKTTVTLLVEHILKNAGIKAKALGNVGRPLIEYVDKADAEEVIVAELSSFQLETMSTPALDAGIILNITADHLDRYRDMQAYAIAKCRLHRCLKNEAPFYMHYSAYSEFRHLIKDENVQTFGFDPKAHFWTNKEMAKQAEKIEYILPLSYRDLGRHECENALAAWLLVERCGVSKAQFLQGLETFTKPLHRIEFVKKIAGVSYFNDSKGTNVDAAIRAVETMPGPVVLIAGGVDKGGSYEVWKSAFKDKVKKIFAIGQAAAQIQAELRHCFNVEIAPSLLDAVQCAASQSQAGDCVLLSPGCASYDMFRDYAHRGEEFKRFVDYLEKRKIS